MNDLFDVVIVGGGLNGLTLALALSELPIQVALVHEGPLQALPEKEDGRALALGASNVDFLNHCGVPASCWAESSAIENIHISGKGLFGVTRLEAEEFGLEALGRVIPAVTLHNVILEQLLARKNKITLYPQTQVTALKKEQYMQLETEQLDQPLLTKLVVAADGAHSKLRAWSGIQVETLALEQTAMVARVRHTKKHQHVAYERFLPEGSIALLPMFDPHESTVVWTLEGQHQGFADSDEGLVRVQEDLGWRLGKFTAMGECFCYPIHAAKALSMTGEGLALLGNAAQTISPVAAQGFNLGLREAQELIHAIRQTLDKQKDCADPSLLFAYEKGCKKIQETTFSLTGFLSAQGRTDTLGRRMGMSLGFGLMNLVSPLRKQFSTFA